MRLLGVKERTGSNVTEEEIHAMLVALDTDLSFEENLMRIDASDHARFPVKQGSMQNILGIAYFFTQFL